MSRRRKHVVFKLIGSLVTSPYRGSMLALLLLSGAILGVELWVGLQLASIVGRMIDALAQRDAAGFSGVMLTLSGLMVAVLFCISLHTYFNERLKMQARTALTYPWLRHWLSEEAIYRLEREKRIDNPDQRIAEDLNLFLDKTLNLLMGGLGAIGGVWAFSTRLWQQGGSLELGLGGQTWSVPGYLFWVAVTYSVFDFVLTRWIAKPQIDLNMQQQHVEADFRFSLVQVREHAEQVAFYRGGTTEFRRLTDCFELVRQNWWCLIAYQAGLNVYSSVTGRVSNYLLYFLLGPRVLAGAMTVGTVTSLQLLFGQTLAKLNWLANSWSGIVEWLAVVRRLKEMDSAIDQLPAAGIEMGAAENAVLSTHNLALALPDGCALTTVGDLRMQPGQRWLVRGPSGTGKSTLLRAIAGLWPHGAGRIEPPLGRLMFLPQKNYLPWDTLKVVLTYPRPADAYDDEVCRQTLIDCRLPALANRLHEQTRWNMRLSPGEQQRLAFARALLSKPDFLFLDESTSALDIETERHLYQLLLERLPDTTLVSVAHRPTLEEFHTHGLDLSADRPAEVRALEVPA
jgi:vitamin B12/bleomycin/antimicrobial peptide transport system ATP-binding/permease protein